MVLTAINQLWRADITYIRLRDEFVFLAVILDAYSRRVIGWALDRTMEDALTLTALRMALSRRVVGPGLVHHSDRGSQYASNDYTDLLKANGIEYQHVAQGQPMGQRGLRVVHENAEVRGGAAQRIPQTWPTPARPSASFWKRSTTRNGCIPRWATCRRPDSKQIKRMPLRGSFLYEFSEASGNLSIRWRRQPCGQRPRSSSG